MKKKVWRVMLVLICLVVAAGAGGVAFLKLRSMYANLVISLQEQHSDLQKRVDRVNRTVTSIDDRISSTFFEFDNSWVEQNPPLIAHAGGGIEGQTYTNSPEAFRHNYEQGQRVFEIDFDVLNNGMMVCTHGEMDWRGMVGVDETVAFDEKNFKESLIRGKYHTMDYRDMIQLMAEYPDAYMVTDSKHTDKQTVMLQFSQLVWYAQKHHPEVLDRIIPQIYHEEMLDWIMDIYPFRSVIFTLYQIGWSPEKIANFAQKTGVKLITIHEKFVDDEVIQAWKPLGIKIAAHTVNDEAAAKAMLDSGIDLIYTDFLLPDQF